MSEFDSRTLSIIAKLGATVRPEIKAVPGVVAAQQSSEGCPAAPLTVVQGSSQLSPVGTPPPPCPAPPQTAYAPFTAPEVTPICDTGPLIKENYAEAFGMALQMFEHACSCILRAQGNTDVTVVPASQQFTGARIP